MSAEMPEHMKRHLRLMKESDIEGIDKILDELEYIWNNPDEYENPNKSGLSQRYEEDPLIYVLHLCIAFGTDYERAYPTGRNEDWPIPVDER